MSTHNVQKEAIGHAMHSRGSSSRDLWEDCPLLDILLNLTRGFYFLDDFLTFSSAEWTATTINSGTTTLADALGGVLAIDAGSTADGDGETVQLNTTVGEIFVPEASVEKNLWFEARVKVDIITGDMFIGLAEILTTLITPGGGVTTSNHLGFSSITGDGVLLSNGEKVDVGDTGLGTTLVAGTYANLGFRAKTVNGVIAVTFYVNGAVVYRVAAASVPLVAMVPSFVMQSEGTTAPIMSVDWIRCAQLR